MGVNNSYHLLFIGCLFTVLILIIGLFCKVEANFEDMPYKCVMIEIVNPYMAELVFFRI